MQVEGSFEHEHEVGAKHQQISSRNQTQQQGVLTETGGRLVGPGAQISGDVQAVSHLRTTRGQTVRALARCLRLIHSAFGGPSKLVVIRGMKP